MAVKRECILDRAGETRFFEPAMDPQARGCFQMLGENLRDRASRELMAERDDKCTAGEVKNHLPLRQLGRFFRGVTPLKVAGLTQPVGAKTPEKNRVGGG